MKFKKFLLVLILNSSFLVVNCYSQQYGWGDISSNVPDFINDTVIVNGGQDTVIAGYADVFFLNDNEGWICTNHGVTTDSASILHTTDGGQTFTTQTTQFQCYAIYMLNSQLGYAGGIQGRVYKTTNGGADWIVHGSIGGTLLDIDFPPNSDSGYCSGFNGKIYKITSNGISSMSSGVAANLYSISFPGRQGWVCGEQVILHFNGSWVGDQSNPTETYNAIHMDSQTTGWAAGDNGVIIHTTDGFNWDYQTNPDALNRTLLKVFFLNVNEGWIVGNSGVILHTINGGTDWNIILNGWTTKMLRSVQFTSSTNGYILGNNKTLFKYGFLTNVEQQPTQPTEFKLEQNYPNPFNPSTSIQYAIGSRQFVQLKLFDVLGNEIATLVDEEKSAGSYEVEFRSSVRSRRLANGVYYYQLRAGDYIQTKKMILMK